MFLGRTYYSINELASLQAIVEIGCWLFIIDDSVNKIVALDGLRFCVPDVKARYGPESMAIRVRRAHTNGLIPPPFLR